MVVHDIAKCQWVLVEFFWIKRFSVQNYLNPFSSQLVPIIASVPVKSNVRQKILPDVWTARNYLSKKFTSRHCLPSAERRMVLISCGRNVNEMGSPNSGVLTVASVGRPAVS